MKLMFIGADHEVTGSCHYLSAAGKNILIDYGMEQGKNTFENVPLPIQAGDIDYVFVTHAHIDHTGLLPVLGAQGFHGQIFATEATCDLCGIMLLDSAHIQEFEAEWRNRKGIRKGLPPFQPLYTTSDAQRVLTHFVECPYDQIINVSDNIRIRFTDIGHLLGSAAIEVWVTEDGKETKLVFSGDIGNKMQPLLRDPQKIEETDYLLIESTYGTRSHEARPDHVTPLSEIIQRTFDRGGNVVIPSFAVGRTQEMLYIIREIKEKQLIQGHPDFPVYVDSPLATKATEIFRDHYADCLDSEVQELLAKGINPLAFPGLCLSETSDESKAINADPTPKVIISASGMCEAGRIKHHLKHNLWRKESTILFVGYQAEGSLGRALIEGEKEVTLFGEEIKVEAEIKSLKGISGHADREGLLDWASGFKTRPKKVFVVHGDDDVVGPFTDLLREQLGFDAYAPYSGTVWDLTNNVCLKETAGIPFVRETAPGQTGKKQKTTTPFIRLENAGKRLMAIISASRGLTNKDLAKFADQLTSLCDKWQ